MAVGPGRPLPPWKPEAYDTAAFTAMAPLAQSRITVTGRTVGLPLFESVEVLGRMQTLRRLGAALGRLPR